MTRQKLDKDEPLGSFYMGRMRPPEPKPRRQLPRGLLGSVVILCFAGIIWYAYPQGQEKYDTANVPLIAADTNPYKFKPEDPGGLEVLHQDSTVFNPIERKQVAAVEKLMPLPEEPVNKTEVIEAAKARAPIESKAPELNLDLQMQNVGKGTERVVTKAEAAALAAAKEKADKKKQAALEKQVNVKIQTKQDTADALFDKEDAADKTDKLVLAAPAKMPAKPQPKPKTLSKNDANPEPEAAALPTGTAPAEAVPVYIRLGSYRDAVGANADWTKLSNKYPQYLKNLQVRILKTDLGPRGIYYRLEAGKLSDMRAKQICDMMKAVNSGGCLIVR